MRTEERLRALKKYIYENLCKGREMKAPAYSEDGYTIDVTKLKTQEPKVSLAWEPTRPNYPVIPNNEQESVVPGIVIMPAASYAKYVEEKRFDRFNNVHRIQEMGQELAVDILFKIYEPGVRLPGFADSADSLGGLDMSLIREGTEEGLFTLVNWMDDCIDMLIADKFIPGTDLFVSESSMVYSLYTDQNYVVDKRPIYYGYIKLKLIGYADRRVNKAIDEYLR